MVYFSMVEKVLQALQVTNEILLTVCVNCVKKPNRFAGRNAVTTKRGSGWREYVLTAYDRRVERI